MIYAELSSDGYAADNAENQRKQTVPPLQSRRSMKPRLRCTLNCQDSGSGENNNVAHLYSKYIWDGCPATVNGQGRPLVWMKAQSQDILAQAPAHFAKLESGTQNWTQQLICRYL